MVVGGEDGNRFRDDVEVIDLSAQRKLHLNLQNYPYIMAAATGAIVSGIPIICGGFSTSASTRYPECYKYDNSTRSWTFLTNMTIGRNFCASVQLNDSLFVMGGSCDGGLDDCRLSTTEYISLDRNGSQSKEIFSPLFLWAFVDFSKLYWAALLCLL